MDVLTAREVLGLGNRGYIPDDAEVLAGFKQRWINTETERRTLHRALATVADDKSSEFLKQCIPHNVFNHVQNLISVQYFAKQASLFNSGKFSDVKVICEGRCWKLHRSILASQSQFFKTTCSSDYCESWTGIITFQETDPRLLHHMLRFLYTCDYEDDDDHELGPLEFHASIYALADKYLISSLKELASHKFLEDLDGPALAKEELADFLGALEIIYSCAGADSGLLDELETVILYNPTILKNNKRFAALIRSGGRLAENVVRTLMCTND